MTEAEPQGSAPKSLKNVANRMGGLKNFTAPIGKATTSVAEQIKHVGTSKPAAVSDKSPTTARSSYPDAGTQLTNAMTNISRGAGAMFKKVENPVEKSAPVAGQPKTSTISSALRIDTPTGVVKPQLTEGSDGGEAEILQESVGGGTDRSIGGETSTNLNISDQAATTASKDDLSTFSNGTKTSHTGGVGEKMSAPATKLTGAVSETFQKVSGSSPRNNDSGSISDPSTQTQSLPILPTVTGTVSESPVYPTKTSADDGVAKKMTAPVTKLTGAVAATFQKASGGSSPRKTELSRSISDPSMHTQSLPILAATGEVSESPDESPDESSNKSPHESPDESLNEDKGENPQESVPEKFFATYWPKKSKLVSLPEDGHMFLTASELHFVRVLGNKKIVWDWRCITAEKATSMHGAVNNAIRITESLQDGEKKSYFFTLMQRDNAHHLISLKIDQSQGATVEESEETNLPKVPPDAVLKRMDVILKKKLRGVSVRDFYDICWAEGHKTDKDPFYGPWLESSGNDEVHVGDWEFADGANDFVGGWCGEHYNQKRIVTYKFTRTTHLYIGPPVCDVKQTQYCRIEGNDKCVMAMTTEMIGIPYDDYFSVELRWVATRVGASDLSLNLGVFVNMVKSTMLASKIRSGTIEETKPIQIDLFENAKKACSTLVGGKMAEEEEEEVEKELVEAPRAGNVCFFFGDFFAKLFGGRRQTAFLDAPRGPMDNEHAVACAIYNTSDTLKKLLGEVEKARSEDSAFAEKEDKVCAEIEDVNQSLKKILEELR